MVTSIMQGSVTAVLAAIGGVLWLREQNSTAALQQDLQQQLEINSELVAKLDELQQDREYPYNFIVLPAWLLLCMLLLYLVAPEKSDFLRERLVDLSMNIIVLLEINGEGGYIIEIASRWYLGTIVVELVLVAIRASRRLSGSIVQRVVVSGATDRTNLPKPTPETPYTPEDVKDELIDFLLDKNDLLQICIELSFSFEYLSDGYRGVLAILNKTPASLLKACGSVYDRWTRDQELLASREAIRAAILQKEQATMEAQKTKTLAAEKTKKTLQVAKEMQVHTGRVDFGIRGLKHCSRCGWLTRNRGCIHNGQKIVLCQPCYKSQAHLSSCPWWNSL
eukprot:TRINITY_DN20059_c0_g1_i1.p1 TRINITY_DN20059_c0_g1~~TRINITY_DN20059_c0_g1_i1.p1  ORF type:complete len:336 (-),score=51.10 TRINITY_DN20059_c0_g1_i1:368-1375(-)